jgi:hypothetical protein
MLQRILPAPKPSPKVQALATSPQQTVRGKSKSSKAQSPEVPEVSPVKASKRDLKGVVAEAKAQAKAQAKPKGKAKAKGEAKGQAQAKAAPKAKGKAKCKATAGLPCEAKCEAKGQSQAESKPKAADSYLLATNKYAGDDWASSAERKDAISMMTKSEVKRRRFEGFRP